MGENLKRVNIGAFILLLVVVGVVAVGSWVTHRENCSHNENCYELLDAKYCYDEEGNKLYIDGEFTFPELVLLSRKTGWDIARFGYGDEGGIWCVEDKDFCLSTSCTLVLGN